MTAREVVPVWQPSDLQRRLVTVAAISLLAAVALGRPTVVVLAAPVLGALLAGHLRPAPRGLCIEWHATPIRLVEGEPLTLEVRVHPPVGRLSGALAPVGLPQRLEFTADERGARWMLTPLRWGRWQVGPLRMRVTASNGLVQAEFSLPLDELIVYPAAPRLRLLPTAERTAHHIGEHIAALTGAGGEFAMVRPLRPGDAGREINWTVSRRRQELHVNQRWAEHAQDLVVVVDTFSDVGPPGRSSLDVAVRGVTATVEGYLHHHDRVGVILLDGMLRWLGPDASGRQFYRIIDHVLATSRSGSAVAPRLWRLPRHALPPGALVVMFSPLLDDRAVQAVLDLAQRGFPIIVVDVLTADPPAQVDDTARLALRLWRLDRLALRHELAGLGAVVLPWDATFALDTAMRPLRRHRLAGLSRGSG